jgi:hypothetical protein
MTLFDERSDARYMLGIFYGSDLKRDLKNLYHTRTKPKMTFFCRILARIFLTQTLYLTDL